MLLKVSTPNDVTLYKLSNGRYGLILADVRKYSEKVSDKLLVHPYFGVILTEDFKYSCEAAWKESGRLWSYHYDTEFDIVEEYTGDIPSPVPNYLKDVPNLYTFTPPSSYYVSTPNSKPFKYYNLSQGNTSKALIYADLCEFKCIQEMGTYTDRYLGFSVDPEGEIYNYLHWDLLGINFRYKDADLSGLYTPPTKEEAIIQEAKDSIEIKIERIEAKIESLHRFLLEKFS